MHARTPTALLHILLSSLLLFVIGMDSRRFVQRVSADAAIEDAATGTSSGHRLLVVVGGGAAGLSAAIEAARLGAEVLVLEKSRAVGGNSAKASSGINGASSEVQMAQHIEDSPELFMSDTEVAGKNVGDHRLVSRLAQESAEAIAFLVDLNLPLQELIQLGGHSVRRTHRLASHAPIGMSMIKALSQQISTIPNVRVETNATVEEVLYEDRSGGRRVVTGVRYRNSAGVDVELAARAVVLASGGMAYDQSAEGLLARHAPGVLGLATSSGPQADGAGMKIAAKFGASLVDMQHVQVHPTGLIDPASPAALSKILGPETLRGSGGILITRSGKRFANELGTRGYLTNSIFEHGDDHTHRLESGRVQKTALVILNRQAVEKFGTGLFNFYKSRGIMRSYADAATMCQEEGVDFGAFRNTLEDYSAAASAAAASGGGQSLDPFGKTTFPVSEFSISEELYVANVTPVIHYTMGGVKINERAEVQTQDPTLQLLGLFAAGEVTGGVHGADRLAGNSLLDCVVFGRTAGRSAIDYLMYSPDSGLDAKGEL